MPSSSTITIRHPLLHHGASILSITLLALLLHFLAPRVPFDLPRFTTTLSDASLHATPAAPSPRTCPDYEKQLFTYPKVEGKMTLVENATRVAHEFEFGADAVRKAVKEFIREMGASTR